MSTTALALPDAQLALENVDHVVVGGVKYTLTEGWDVKTALETVHVELPTMRLDKVFVPLTRVEVFNWVEPKIYSQVCGFRIKAQWDKDSENCGLGRS